MTTTGQNADYDDEQEPSELSVMDLPLPLFEHRCPKLAHLTYLALGAKCHHCGAFAGDAAPNMERVGGAVGNVNRQEVG